MTSSGCHVIRAPEGFEGLLKDEHYYFLKSAPNGRVYFVHFEGHENNKPRATLIWIDRKELETAITSGLIVRERGGYLPPWLSELEGQSLAELDANRPKAKRSYSERVDQRINYLEKALANEPQIWEAEDPKQEINRYAALCEPRQHETRFRLSFLTFLAFGRNRMALLPPFHRAGHYERKSSHKKYGRPALAKGRRLGRNLDDATIKIMLDIFPRLAVVGTTQYKIYEKIMRDVLKCEVITSSKGIRSYQGADGKAAPTYYQFRYRIMQRYGIEFVHIRLYGRVRSRSKSPSEGRFSEAVGNLCERIEADGYYTRENPAPLVQGDGWLPLCVVTSRDVLSGAKLGIGFHYGKERASAYRMMLFSMAVPKVFFCWLFGLKISEGEWMNEGLPPLLIVDRGPGAKRNLIADFESKFPIREMSPSYQGQSKATVESSHPRSNNIPGAPAWFRSELTPVQLAKKEICRLLEFNDSPGSEARIQADRRMAEVYPTPNAIWKHFSGRFRTSEQHMSINDAVRNFLTPVEIKASSQGFSLHDQPYSCDATVAKKVLNGIARKGQTITLKGYALDMCVRYIWIEIDGAVHLAEAKLIFRDNEEKLFITLSELIAWEEARAAINSEMQGHREATQTENARRFEESTGAKWDSTERVSGKKPAKSRKAA